MFIYFGAGPVIVGAVADDEFYLVVGFEVMNVLPIVAFDFAAGRCFEIDDAESAGVTGGDVAGAAGFDEDGFVEITECGDEGVDFGLEEWFAAGEFDEVTGVAGNFGEDVFLGAEVAFGECVGGIAVVAAEVATGKADEDAGETCVG